jgi:GT2 family glycosyltransferase
MLEDVKVGEEYFDESYFAMLEDVDLDWRAQLRGWKCVYAPRALAYHYRSASGVQKSRLIQRHYYKNRYLTMLKNDTLRSVLKYSPSILLMDLYLNLDIAMTSPSALFLAWWDLFCLFPDAVSKRRMIQSRRKVDQEEIEKWFQKYSFMDDVRRKLGLQQRQNIG